LPDRARHPQGSLAVLRESTKTDRPRRFAQRQSWELCEQLGHSLRGDTSLRLGRVSSQDSGVDANAEVVVATASLEVGFNDPEVGAVLQHKDTEEGRTLWGKRHCRFFVFNRESSNFAPVKFCAFVDARLRPNFADRDQAASPVGGFMSVESYAALDERESRFDGTIAWKHLLNNVAFTRTALADVPTLAPIFAAWSRSHSEAVSVREEEIVLLLPPPWG
jgi:hypothetical protein